MVSLPNSDIPEAGLGFDEIDVGRRFPAHRLTLSAELIEAWQSIHQTIDGRPLPGSDPSGPPPAALIFLCMLQTLIGLRILPDGGILASYTMQFRNPPRRGETLATYTRVADKYIRRERRYVEIEFTVRRADRHIAGRIRARIIWPR
ncbi:MAG: hypothetical protein HY314_15215 [Acidobacteria bacterium]|nr:hypothetical protein [Acidobacteriota bacterium]